MCNVELFEKADRLYDQGSYKEAFSIFKQLAISDDTSCMVRIASMYTCGESVECDYDQAIEWELQAVKLGDVTAMNNVAISYRMKGDILNSKYWFEKALDAGECGAALELAKLYMVSDKEMDKVKEYLLKVVAGKNVCVAEIEEAQQFLQEL